MKPEERLAEQLDAKDEEISALEEKIEKLARELEGSADGWRRTIDLVDDTSLPLPRLELVYEQTRGWADYRVTYRLVLRHLLGEVYAVPLGVTKCSGGPESRPAPEDLPYREGAHAAHDAAFLGLQCFKVMPGRKPELLTFADYTTQPAKGREHRRPAGDRGSRP